MGDALRLLLFAALASGVAGCATWSDDESLWFDAVEPALGPQAAHYGYGEPLAEELEDEPWLEPVEPEPGGRGGERLGSLPRTHRLCTLSSPTVRVLPTLSAQDVRTTVMRHENEVRACYNRALVRDRTASGRVVMSFRIAPDGTVPAAVVSSTQIRDARLDRCMTRAVKRWTFPVPPQSRPTTVNYPYVFSVPPKRWTAR